MNNAHCSDISQVLSNFNVTPEKGLTSKQVEEARAKYGRNELPAEEKTPLWKLVLKQFDDILVRILLGSAFISFIFAFFEEHPGLQSFIEPFVILLVLALNAYIGVSQESSAEAAIDALKSFEAPKGVVIRDGKVKEIDAIDLVPGDIVKVSVGNIVPADCRIISLDSTTLRVDQSALTGESVSVMKEPEIVKQEKIELQGKTNIIFSGTLVTYGKALAIVVSTGINTEIGKISKSLSNKKSDDDEEEIPESEKTPLQKNLDQFGNQLTIAVAIICAVVFIINVPHFNDPAFGGWWMGAVYYLKYAIALAVAAIPEGLPTVITMTFSIGAQRMAKRNAIVRKLPAVETLGACSVICSDKTGTLTTNKMSVCRCITIENIENNNVKLSEYEAEDSQFKPNGKILLNGKVVENPSKSVSLLETAKIATLCNDASLIYNDEKNDVEVSGEPTEAALLVFAEKVKLPNDSNIPSELSERYCYCSNQWRSKYTKEATLEFTRARKSMSVYYKEGFLFCKGAYENVIHRCDKVLVNSTGKVVPLTEEMKESIIDHVRTNFSDRLALRCLATSYIEQRMDKASLGNADDFERIETGMTLTGVVGLIDPPRTEVKDSIHTCRKAGIRVIVITGDNINTAESICRGIGLFDDISDSVSLRDEKLSFTGKEFEEMNEDQQKEILKTARLFARVEPQHKLTIVKILQEEGFVVAMTGDGVNDSPALKKSDIGLAMGSGTSVAKSASKLILQDDNFTTIVKAVEEGRVIFSNTKQFIRYLISSNIGEVVSIFLASLLGIPEHLNTIQLLFVNLVTDGLPANALGLNPGSTSVMTEKPRKTTEPLVNAWQLVRYLIVGTYIGFATVMGYIYYFTMFDEGPQISYSQLVNFSKCDPTVANCALFDRENLARPSTISLSILVLIEMFNALSSISENDSILVLPPTRNKYLILSVILSIIVHCIVLYTPINFIFNVYPISLHEWIVVIAFSLPVVIIDEVLKFVARNFIVNTKSKQD